MNIRCFVRIDVQSKQMQTTNHSARHWHRLALDSNGINSNSYDKTRIATKRNTKKKHVSIDNNDKDRTQFVLCIFQLFSWFDDDRSFISFSSSVYLFICSSFSRLLSNLPADTLGLADAPRFRFRFFFLVARRKKSFLKKKVSQWSDPWKLVSLSLRPGSWNVQFNVLSSWNIPKKTFPYEWNRSFKFYLHWLMPNGHVEWK